MIAGSVAEMSNAILKFRLEQPNLVIELARNRKRRLNWAKDRLVILAIDHPARREVAVSGDPWAMANRADLLRRICTVLKQPGIDGLLATPDIMEEVLLLSYLSVQQGGPDFVNEKILVGSMNRAGLSGTTFELDDFVTAYTADAIQQANLDAGKLLFRLDPDSRDSLSTMCYCVTALNELNHFDLPCFLEPLTSSNTTDDLVRLVGVATGMGTSSRNRWLKLPMVVDFQRLATTTTCPIVLLGGKSPGTTAELLQNVSRCMDAGPNVRGLMIGRGVLYPTDGKDSGEVAAELVAKVHEKNRG